MENGDMLTGTVRYMDGNKLRLSTSHSGPVMVQRRRIHSLVIERNVNIELKNGQEVQGSLQSVSTGVTQVNRIDDTPLRLDSLADISFLYYVSPLNQEVDVSGSIIGEVDFENTESRNNHIEWEVALDNTVSYAGFRNNTRLEYEKDSTNGRAVNRETIFDNSSDYLFAEKVFVTGRFRYEEDLFENLSRRYVLGVGLGHQAWKNPFRELIYSVDLVHLDERYQQGQDIVEKGIEFRLNFKEETLINGLYFQHESSVLFISLDNRRIESLSSLEYGLPYNIGINLNYEWDYNDAPEAGNGKAYRNLTIGVSYRW